MTPELAFFEVRPSESRVMGWITAPVTVALVRAVMKAWTASAAFCVAPMAWAWTLIGAAVQAALLMSALQLPDASVGTLPTQTFAPDSSPAAP
ncbi:hypothetical protein [Methylobacterium aquaticum]|uniref:hypothetical protein n=1 Tax=Methylobacterium aquaticum TaxID=270351 RepID=UPI000652CCFA|nr:hypothetical protein [Methylobacterium aquaticum]